jgi:Uma2 family endonuclease
MSSEAAVPLFPPPGPPSPGVIVYPSDKMGYSHLQHEVCRVTGGLMISYFIAQRRMVRVGGELNFVVREGHPPLLVVPDLYILEDEPQSGPKVPSWKPAEHEGKVPTLAVEVVSDSYQKDYDPEEALSRYQELGVPEVVRYDPDFAGHRRSKHARRLLTHFVRDARGGLVAQPDIGKGDRVFIKRYALWLIHQPRYTLRLATGTLDDLHIWPTDAERARTEAARADQAEDRAQAEAERAQAEAERAQAEAERARQAEDRIRILEAELSRLR